MSVKAVLVVDEDVFDFLDSEVDVHQEILLEDLEDILAAKSTVTNLVAKRKLASALGTLRVKNPTFVEIVREN